mgnify:FL=1|jgi:hypothetical protein
MSDLTKIFLFFMMPSKFVLDAFFAMSFILISFTRLYNYTNKINGILFLNTINHRQNQFNHIQFLNYVSQAALI